MFEISRTYRHPVVVGLSILALAGCNSKESKVRKAMANGSAVVVLRKDNVFLAIPVSGIRSVDNNKITVVPGTTIAVAFKDNCEGSDEGIAYTLADRIKNLRMDSRNPDPSFVAYNTRWKATVRGSLLSDKGVTPYEIGGSDEIYVDQ